MTENNHWPNLAFQSENGDLCICDCGEQGYDFADGREWFMKHMTEVIRNKRHNPYDHDCKGGVKGDLSPF